MLNLKNIRSIVLAGALFAAALPASAEDIAFDCAVPLNPVGQVMTLTGGATAVDGNGCSRILACGSSLYGGETLTTGGTSSAGFLVGDVLSQVGADSKVKIGTTPSGAADVTLVKGNVRVIDPRESGPPVRLSALDTSTQFTGNSAGAAISDGRAAYCADSPIPVTQGGRTTSADPGACDATAAGGAFAAGGAGGGGGATPISGGSCMQVAANSHVQPLPPVSSPPGDTPFPDPPESPPRNPCEVGACGRSFDPPPGNQAPPPSQTPFPGSGGNQAPPPSETPFPGDGGFPGGDS
jgi:hypothetical protein